MRTSPAADTIEPAQPASESQDCLECRLIGTGALTALSGYFVYLTHTLPSTATVFHRRFNLSCSVGFALAAIARFLA